MNQERIYCNSCKGETLHNLIKKHEHQRYDPFWGFSQLFVSEIFMCCGCEDITFRLTKNPFSFQDAKDEPDVTLLPKRGYKNREKRHYFKLPKQIHKLYQETISAHDNELIILSTVGVRSLIEAIVADKVDKSKYKNNLQSKIDSLSQYFPDKVINVLHDFRAIGNKAAHELQAPETLNIHHALYVVEGMLEFFYGIEEKADTFKNYRERNKKNPLTKK